jgi:transcriptional regulator with XRE-family HTH domain
MITRIRELLEARQLSPTQFADLIGVGRPVISHILSERNKPSLEVVQKIIGAFPDISLPWLLAGTGSMLAAASASSPSAYTASATEAVSAPVLAATAVVAPPLASPIPPLAAPARPTTVSQPGNYPQPPRFRPGATAPITPATTEAAPASPNQVGDNSFATTLPSAGTSPLSVQVPATASATVASSLRSSSPLPAPVAASSIADPALLPLAQAPAPLPLATPPTVPIASGTLGGSTAPLVEVPAIATSSEVSAPSSNPAAALSFLGEPGKAIRRIVIFYRDGSFSDYVPEGS